MKNLRMYLFAGAAAVSAGWWAGDANLGHADIEPSVSEDRVRFVDDGDAEPMQSGGGVVPERYQGLTMRQREFAERADRGLAGAVADYERRCGQPIQAEIEWRSFAADIDDALDNPGTSRSRSLAPLCRTFVEHVAWVCHSGEPTVRSTILSRVHSYTCVSGGGAPRALSLEGDHAVMSIEYGTANWDQWIADQLGRML